jgi:hypothetical protein
LTTKSKSPRSFSPSTTGYWLTQPATGIYILLYMCPHTTAYCVPRPTVYTCPHTTVYVVTGNLFFTYSRGGSRAGEHGVVVCAACVLIRLRMCLHTTTYVSSYGYVSVFIRLVVSSYFCICPRILGAEVEHANTGLGGGVTLWGWGVVCAALRRAPSSRKSWNILSRCTRAHADKRSKLLSYYHMCVLIPLYVSSYVSSYYYIEQVHKNVLILPSNHNTCVPILLYMSSYYHTCPHTTTWSRCTSSQKTKTFR